MHTAHISFPATDKVVLPGLLYTPAKPTSRVAVWLHGMGDSGVFYSPKRITALAEKLTDGGVALLAFNNRGAHNSKLLYKDAPDLPKKDLRYQGGTHYELIADCVADINGAVQFLTALHYETFYLAGHSTGANKICVYDSLTQTTPFTKYVLAGPGDDVGLNYIQLGPAKFGKALEYAKHAVNGGTPLKTMPLYTGMHPFSAQSTYDMLNPDGQYNTFPYFEVTHEPLGSKPLFAEYGAIKTPMLVIAGSEDEATATAGGAHEALKMLRGNTNSLVRDRCTFEIIHGSDHSFTNYETEFAETIAAWLT